ncbi:MAG: hypothetical protein QOF70_6009, partial [Acetobacteraceae bacterium]|nr:hypothetical protein [Acetobacteraceae bacterium]
MQNWPEYEAGLRRRGSLILWIEDTALECWQTWGPGGQARYSDAAIQTSLMVRTAFKLPLRQAEGLMTSVLTTGCGFLKAVEFGCRPPWSWAFCCRQRIGYGPVFWRA